MLPDGREDEVVDDSEGGDGTSGGDGQEDDSMGGPVLVGGSGEAVAVELESLSSSEEVVEVEPVEVEGDPAEVGEVEGEEVVLGHPPDDVYCGSRQSRSWSLAGT